MSSNLAERTIKNLSPYDNYRKGYFVLVKSLWKHRVFNPSPSLEVFPVSNFYHFTYKRLCISGVPFRITVGCAKPSCVTRHSV